MRKELSERKKKILKAIIDAHIDSGDPVGSRFLTEKSGLGLSAATIRNEMAELESMGYLSHPHTSAGRIPTELGYRFYVDGLMQSYDMKTNEVKALNDMLADKVGELDRILEKAGRFMSKVTNYTALSVQSSPREETVARLNLIHVTDNEFILAIVMQSGEAKTKYIRSPVAIGEFTLRKLENVLSGYIVRSNISGITLNDISRMEREMGDDSFIVSAVIREIYSMTGDDAEGQVRIEGVDRLLEYPEFSDTGKLKNMLKMLEERNDIKDIIKDGDDGVQVLIGKENSKSVMNDSAFVYKTIKNDGKIIGAIGVIGPCRMDYSKVISTIDALCGTIEKYISGSALPPGKEDR